MSPVIASNTVSIQAILSDLKIPLGAVRKRLIVATICVVALIALGAIAAIWVPAIKAPDYLAGALLLGIALIVSLATSLRVLANPTRDLARSLDKMIAQEKFAIERLASFPEKTLLNVKKRVDYQITVWEVRLRTLQIGALVVPILAAFAGKGGYQTLILYGVLMVIGLGLGALVFSDALEPLRQVSVVLGAASEESVSRRSAVFSVKRESIS